MGKDPTRRPISDIDLDRRRRLTVTPPPSDLKVPDSDTFSDEEGTPVVDKQEVAWEEIGRMSKNIRGLITATNNQAEHVKHIPEMQRDVKAAKRSADKALQRVELVDTKLGTDLKHLDRRVDKVEDRGHDCAQVAIIASLQEGGLETRRKVERDVEEGVKTRERLDNTRSDLETVDKAVKSFSTARRNFFMGLIGVAVFVAGTVGSLIWFLSSLETKFEAEQRERRASDSRIETQVKAAGKAADTAPVERQIKTLAKAVKAANGHETTDQFCSGLSDQAVRAMKRSVPRRDWPRCRRFGLEPIRPNQ